MRLRPHVLLLLFTLAALVGGAALYFQGGNDNVVLTIYADRTLQPALEEIVGDYVDLLASQGVNVEVKYIYGSSGFALSQLELAGSGDLYVADGLHYAMIGVEKGVLDGDSVKKIGVIRLALIVAEGNPKGIKGLSDALTRPDVKLAVGNPEHVTAGVLAWRLFDDIGVKGKVEQLVGEGRVVVVESAFQAANLVVLGVVDAALTFNIYNTLYPSELDEVYDPQVASVRDYVVVALPSSRGPLAEDLYTFVLENAGVFYKYGVEPLDDD